jgi:hypothetical protein
MPVGGQTVLARHAGVGFGYGLTEACEDWTGAARAGTFIPAP